MKKENKLIPETDRGNEFPFVLMGDETVHPVAPGWPADWTVSSLYEALRKAWCADTCAPRLRSGWTEDDPTVGQCSVTAFLAQDIFGGEVFGVPLGDGHFHCYNRVDRTVFDLTDAQFRPRKLDYPCLFPQNREVHFADAEKKSRYELLSARLKEIVECL